MDVELVRKSQALPAHIGLSSCLSSRLNPGPRAVGLGRPDLEASQPWVGSTSRATGGTLQGTSDRSRRLSGLVSFSQAPAKSPPEKLEDLSELASQQEAWVHVWHVDGNGHDATHWRNNLWLFAQRLIK